MSAKGAKAIEAIRRPLAFAVYARPVVAVILGLAVVFGGHDPLGISVVEVLVAAFERPESSRSGVARLQEDERLLPRKMGGDGAAVGSSTEIGFR